ncbi:hypothetical protein LTR36_005968 [Oleoguttula mirabilis]|uniref:BTB domain-containing protein n=1 Tax=Oleoguttula mirabilis TaxID=1507867 RepID=A0AAV9JDV1_9PEZI|nr:hypothetical protein LTR36_005968 [Oleoguttula mirabilis]
MPERTSSEHASSKPIGKDLAKPFQQFHNNLSGERVTVIVGQDQEQVEFNFPKALLCSRSAWFDTAFREGRFVEGKAGRITLPDDSPSAFMAFEYYVYFEDLAYVDLMSLPDDHDEWREHFEHCIEVWVLGDKYHMPGLQNTIMLRACEVLKRKMDTVFSLDALTLCFQHSTRGSPLRKIAADYIVHKIECEGMRIDDWELCFGFDGFFAEIYESKSCFHDLPSHDFPRYKKAVSYGDLFRMHGDKVTVTVGQDEAKKTFTVSKELLCSQSKWFAKALDGRFKEGITGTVELPHDSSQVFAAFYYHLHHRVLAFTPLDTMSKPLELQLLECLNIWIFGDKYELPGLQNCASLRACEMMAEDTALSMPTMQACFERTARGSPIRCLLAEYIVKKVETDGDYIGEYDDIAGIHGSLSELYEAQRFYHSEVGKRDFPRYGKPLKYSSLFYTPSDGGAEDFGAQTGDNMEGYEDGDTAATYSSCWDTDPSCEDCGDSPGEKYCKRCESSGCYTKPTCRVCGLDDQKTLCYGCIL